MSCEDVVAGEVQADMNAETEATAFTVYFDFFLKQPERHIIGFSTKSYSTFRRRRNSLTSPQKAVSLIKQIECIRNVKGSNECNCSLDVYLIKVGYFQKTHQINGISCSYLKVYFGKCPNRN